MDTPGVRLTLTAEDTPFSLTVADFDLDGGLDLAAANLESSSISLFLNLGTMPSARPFR